MPRKPDPNGKTKRVVFAPKTPEEETLSTDFKKLCIQDGVEQNDMLKEAIGLLFAKHHFPPGNPQRPLEPFILNKTMSLFGTCGFTNCPEHAIAKGTFLPTGKLYHLCPEHKRAAESNRQNWRLET
jgi:hypothetical protein